MSKRKPLTDADGEVRELTVEDMRQFRPADSTLSASLRRKLKLRGAQKAPTKERITIRLSANVVQHFRQTGAGWQTRLNAALEAWLEAHPSKPRPSR